MEHAEFSPSKLQQIKLCPASYKMQIGLPEQTSEYAAEGQALHKAIETGDVSTLTAEQRELVEQCAEFLTKLTASREFEKNHEVKLEIKDADGEVLTFGTADVVLQFIDGEKETYVIDWKFGYNPVKDAAENMQTAAYALGVMQLTKADKVKAVIFQPRIKHASAYTFTNAAAILANIKTVIQAAQQDALVFRASEDACRYCKAAFCCPAFRLKIQGFNAAGQENEPEKISDLYEKCKEIKPLIAQVENMLKAEIEKTGACGKFKFQIADGAREIKDLDGAYSAVKDLITQGEFNQICKVSYAKLEAMLAERLIAENGGGIKKAEAKRQAAGMLEAFVTHGNSIKRIVENAYKN